MFQENNGPEALGRVRTVSSFSLSGVRSLVSLRGNHYEGQWAGVTLHSVFQPVYSLAHKRIAGFEALVRPVGREGNPVAPPEFFKGLSTDALVLADRLCRALHVANFQFFRQPDTWLFLNVATEVAVHARRYGSFFTELLDFYDLSPASVVVEVVEHPSEDPLRMDAGISFFRDLGCLIAMDDFGTGASNFERIWRFSPHIVKLERGMIARAGKESRTRRMLPGIVSLLHQAGALVLVEGVEDEEEARIAMEADADLVQGFFFGRPLAEPPEGGPDFERLFEGSKTEARDKETCWRQKNKEVLAAFSRSLEMLVSGERPQAAFRNLLEDSRVLRCYLLRPSGVQEGPTLVAAGRGQPPDPRFAPLQEGRSGDWFRRPYFKRALRTPGRIRVTPPYRSITGEGLCQTLSCHVSAESGSWVVCCDLFFEEEG